MPGLVNGLSARSWHASKALLIGVGFRREIPPVSVARDENVATPILEAVAVGCCPGRSIGIGGMQQ